MRVTHYERFKPKLDSGLLMDHCLALRLSDQRLCFCLPSCSRVLDGMGTLVTAPEASESKAFIEVFTKLGTFVANLLAAE
jgi:hypothetical protein